MSHMVETAVAEECWLWLSSRPPPSLLARWWPSPGEYHAFLAGEWEARTRGRGCEGPGDSVVASKFPRRLLLGSSLALPGRAALGLLLCI